MKKHILTWHDPHYADEERELREGKGHTQGCTAIIPLPSLSPSPTLFSLFIIIIIPEGC